MSVDSYESPTSEGTKPFGGNKKAEIAVITCLAVIFVGIPLVAFIIYRCRGRRRKGMFEISHPATATAEGVQNDEDGGVQSTREMGNSIIRPATATSWLEMLKNKTEAPKPPHTLSAQQMDGELVMPPAYEYPQHYHHHNHEQLQQQQQQQQYRPLSFSRALCIGRSDTSSTYGSDDDSRIEREIRDLDDEVRRSRLGRARVEGIIPDLELGDERFTTATATEEEEEERDEILPVEGRRATPVPFLKTPTPTGRMSFEEEEVVIEEKKGDEREEDDNEKQTDVGFGYMETLDLGERRVDMNGNVLSHVNAAA